MEIRIHIVRQPNLIISCPLVRALKITPSPVAVVRASPDLLRNGLDESGAAPAPAASMGADWNCSSIGGDATKGRKFKEVGAGGRAGWFVGRLDEDRAHEPGDIKSAHENAQVVNSNDTSNARYCPWPVSQLYRQLALGEWVQNASGWHLQDLTATISQSASFRRFIWKSVAGKGDGDDVMSSDILMMPAARKKVLISTHPP
ncbi:hypothetical protein BDW72DRAFT_198443 [Aspergillus terricola var. indicus]